jgi:hypothetical protein
MVLGRFEIVCSTDFEADPKTMKNFGFRKKSFLAVEFGKISGEATEFM